jgi:hypothetical protein
MMTYYTLQNHFKTLYLLQVFHEHLECEVWEISVSQNIFFLENVINKIIIKYNA